MRLEFVGGDVRKARSKVKPLLSTLAIPPALEVGAALMPRYRVSCVIKEPLAFVFPLKTPRDERSETTMDMPERTRPARSRRY